MSDSVIRRRIAVTAVLAALGACGDGSSTGPAAPAVTGEWYLPRAWLPADGTSSTVMRILVTDSNAHPVTLHGGDVAMTTTRGTLGPVTISDSSAEAVLTSTPSVGTAIVTATYQGTQIGPSLSVRFDVHQIWASKAPLTVPREGLGAGVINGILYVVGGDSSWEAGSSLPTLDAYDPGTNSWSARTAMPASRADLAVAVADSKLYAIGGRVTSDSKTVDVYDPATDSWSAAAQMPTARGGLAAETVNGMIYAVGGRVAAPDPVLAAIVRGPYTIQPRSLPGTTAINTVERYDPGTNTWSTVAPMPTARAHLAVGVINGILYAVGGQDGGTEIGALEAYDPATDHWTARAPMPTPREGLAVAVLNGKLYAIGGILSYREADIVEVYDPVMNMWAPGAQLITARLAPAAALLNGQIYAVGGACYDDVLTEVEAYVP
jgi:N-acetylneuraminic acid mutarotase